VVVTGAIFCGTGLEDEEAALCASTLVETAREASTINPSAIPCRRETETQAVCALARNAADV
jgi:hypothetical protein